MPRETALQRGMRFLLEGRLVILRVNDERIEARCRGGSGEIHDLGFDERGWHCSCPALTRCSHLHALQAVCLTPSIGDDRDPWGVAP